MQTAILKLQAYPSSQSSQCLELCRVGASNATTKHTTTTQNTQHANDRRQAVRGYVHARMLPLEREATLSLETQIYSPSTRADARPPRR